MLIGDVMDRRAARISLHAPMSLAAELLVLSRASDLMVVRRYCAAAATVDA